MFLLNFKRCNANNDVLLIRKPRINKEFGGSRQKQKIK